MAAGLELYTTIAFTGGASSSVSALPSSVIFTMRASRPSGERCCNSGISRPARLNWNACEVESCKSAADFAPRSGERGQSRDGAHGRAAVLAALDAVVQADRRGTRGRVLARQLHDVFAGDAGERGHALRIDSRARSSRSSSKPLV